MPSAFSGTRNTGQPPTAIRRRSPRPARLARANVSRTIGQPPPGSYPHGVSPEVIDVHQVAIRIAAFDRAWRRAMRRQSLRRREVISIRSPDLGLGVAGGVPAADSNAAACPPPGSRRTPRRQQPRHRAGPRHGPRPRNDPRLDHRLQRRTASFGPRLPDAQCVRRGPTHRTRQPCCET